MKLCPHCAKPVNGIKEKCKVCGTEYLTPYKNKRYCSNKCKVKAYKKNKVLNATPFN